jgi:hypothetical protein
MFTKSSRLVLGCLLGSLVSSGHAQWLELNGQPAPEVTAARWLNTGGETPNLASLKGKVWILKFFATH